VSEQPPAQDDTQRMLLAEQHGSAITDKFARICLRLFRGACNDAVTWHHMEG
jgi:hypothetical protein